jgi:MFS superfamily sulfate permease-like transporter
MSQSLVNESAGARTPLSGLVAALLVLLVAVFLSGLLHNLPQPVLAAVVLMAVTSLFKISELRHLWKYHRTEFIVAVAALLGVLGQGLLRGVLVGTVLSLLMLLRRGSKPHVAFLGRIPGTRRFSDLERHGDNEAIPGVLAFRVEASLLYFNTEHVLDTVLARLESMPEPPRLVICDLSTSPYVDLAGARMVMTLHEELARRGIALQLVEAHSSVRDILRIEGVEEKVGAVDRFRSLADVVDEHNRVAISKSGSKA